MDGQISVILGAIGLAAQLLGGCGVTSRLVAMDVGQGVKAAAGVMVIAAEELGNVQQATGRIAGTPTLSPSIQPQGVAPAVEDMARVQRQRAQEQELLDHEVQMGRLRRANEIEVDTLKMEQLRERLRGSPTLGTINRLLLEKYLVGRGIILER